LIHADILHNCHDETIVRKKQRQDQYGYRIQDNERLVADKKTARNASILFWEKRHTGLADGNNHNFCLQTNPKPFPRTIHFPAIRFTRKQLI